MPLPASDVVLNSQRLLDLHPIRFIALFCSPICKRLQDLQTSQITCGT